MSDELTAPMTEADELASPVLDDLAALEATETKSEKKRKRNVQRRAAKAALLVSLATAALFVIAEPWLLVAVLALLVALSLWD